MGNKNKYNSIIDCVIDTQNGVDGAFDALYTMSYPYAYNAASQLLKSKEDIEDALQNSFYYVLKYISQLRVTEAYLRWLNQIVINECKKILMAQNKHHKIYFVEKNRLMTQDESGEDEDLQFENMDLIETINKIIDEMKPKKSEILKLYYFDQLSYSEISAKLGIPVGTVMSRLHNAKKELEKKVKELQKNGTVLWSLSVLPFVAALLSYNIKAHVSVASATQISAGVASVSATATSTSATVGAYGAAVTAASAGTTGIGTVAAGIGSSIAVKAAAVALATSVAVGGGVAAKAIIKNKSGPLTETPESYTEDNTQLFYNKENRIIKVSPESTTETTITKLTEQAGLNGETGQTEEFMTVNLPIMNKQNSKDMEQSENPTSRHEKRTTRSKTTTATSSALQTTEVTSRETTTEQPTEKATEITTQAKQESNPPANTTEKQSEATVNPYDGMTVSNGVLNRYNGNGGAVTVPSNLNGQNVTAIGAGAFEGSGVTSVNVSFGITKIGQMAFSDCENLTSVSLPSTVMSIGDCAFDGCASLKSITIPDSVTNIGDNAFDGCDALTIDCSENSVAYKYAVDNGIDYKLI